MERIVKHSLVQGKLFVPLAVRLIAIAVFPAAIFPQTPAPQEPIPPPLMVPESHQSNVPVSDEEVLQFATALSNIQEIQSQTEEETARIIEESELSPERFAELLEATQFLGAESAEHATEKEKHEFDSVMQNLSDLHIVTQERIVQAVVATRLTPERFNEILGIVQTDPDLADQLSRYLGGEQQ